MLDLHLGNNDQSTNRQLQRIGITRVVPMLCATVPNDIWSWDTSPLAAVVKRVFFHLYVILDIYSHYAVNWSVETSENSILAQALFRHACARDGVDANALIAHSDNGPIQRSNVIDDCFSELGITKSYSRPHVSNDNPYSESLFKTVEYQPQYPAKFEDLEQARSGQTTCSPTTTTSFITQVLPCSPQQVCTLAPIRKSS